MERRKFLQIGAVASVSLSSILLGSCDYSLSPSEYDFYGEIKGEKVQSNVQDKVVIVKKQDGREITYHYHVNTFVSPSITGVSVTDEGKIYEYQFNERQKPHGQGKPSSKRDNDH